MLCTMYVDGVCSGSADPVLRGDWCAAGFCVARALLERETPQYDETALSFKKDDVILVQHLHSNGLWEGQVLRGKEKGPIGHFPFTLVDIIDPKNYDDHIRFHHDLYLAEQEVSVLTAIKKGNQLEKRPSPITAAGNGTWPLVATLRPNPLTSDTSTVPAEADNNTAATTTGKTTCRPEGIYPPTVVLAQPKTPAQQPGTK
eukprot:m.287496 g.287496  ORF g.287496 m.287496 type:complete len:201 (+) comp19947_c0_seq2:159-761(+)